MLTLHDALARSFIGLDHANRLAQASAPTNYPPFNIEQLNDDEYVLSLAVAGFSEQEIEITLHNSLLSIKGEKQNDGTAKNFLHRGLGQRNFEKTFTLAEHIHITDVHLEHGMLTLKLQRKVPESAKPRRIAIGSTPVPSLKVA